VDDLPTPLLIPLYRAVSGRAEPLLIKTQAINLVD
jgi:hypothetical protein